MVLIELSPPPGPCFANDLTFDTTGNLDKLQENGSLQNGGHPGEQRTVTATATDWA